MMFRGIIGQGIEALSKKGVVYTTKATLNYIASRIRWLYCLCRDYSSYFISIFLGPDRTLKICLAIFKFRCRYNLFLAKKKAFWLGRSYKDRVYKIIYVNPAEINYEVKGGTVPYIQDGDWDLNKRDFTIHETITKMFVDNLPASETEQYEIMKKAIQKKDWHMSRNCRTQEELDNYFKELRDIYMDFSNGVFRLQYEANKTGVQKRSKLYPDQILLSIGRNGEYILESGGTHRLSIAKLLGLKSVPAVIIRKHYQYVKAKERWLD